MAADAVTPPLPPGFEVDPPLPEGFVADGAAPAAPAAGGLQRTGAAAIPTAAEAAGGAYVPPQPTEAAIAAGQRQQRAAQNPVREKVVGAVEAGLDILSKVVGGGVGGLVGVTGLLGGGGGEKGMEVGAQKGVGLVRDIYRQTNLTDGGAPQTEFGTTLTEGFDQAMANLPPIAGVRGTLAAPMAMPAELGARANLGLAVEPIRKPLEAPIAAMKEVVQRVVPEKKPTPGTKASGGAAATDKAAQRRALAEDIGISITKGQETREFGQQRFERETAKDSESGKPLRERYSEQNEKLQQHLDDLRDLTGAEITDTTDAGARVVKVLGDKAAKAKEEIRTAYDEARAAGEMEMPVAVAEVRKYIDDQTPTTKEKLAPIIKMVDEQIAKNDPEGTGQVSIAALEDIRQAIRANTEYGTPNSVHGAELIKRIDAATEGQGGDLYKAARKKYGEYAAEFKNRAIVADLMGTKKGSADRKVATENVFKRAILGSSGAEELTVLRNTLRSAGDDGKQAWRELQGQTLKHIKDEATKNVARDERGNAIVSAAGMDRAITALDKNGKLDLIFGKNGAQKLRDINDFTKDVYTSPPGAVNTSGTASVLREAVWKAIDTVVTFSTTGAPVPALAILKAAAKKMKSRKTDRMVREALATDVKPKEFDPKARPFEEPEPPPAAAAPVPPKTPAPTTARAEAANPKLAEIERLKKDASPEVAKVLEEQAKKVERQEREVAAVKAKEEQVRKLEETAAQTDDPDLRAALIKRANELRPEKVPTGDVKELNTTPTPPAGKTPKIPVGEATEIPPATGRAPDLPKLPVPKVVEGAPKIDAAEPKTVPAGAAREIPDTPDTRRAVDDLIVNAADEAAWRKLHRFGDLDAKSAQTVGQAIRYDAAAVDRAMVQHERSPRAFEREIARIIEEGKARESEAQQVGRSGEGLERAAGEEPGAAPAKPGQARPDGADAPRTQREEPAAAGGQEGVASPRFTELADRPGIGKIEKQKGLTAEEAAIEQRFSDAVRADPDAMLKKYAELPDTMGGKVVNTDEARELSLDYAKDKDSKSLYAKAVHEPASWIAKAQWDRLLAEKPETGEVLILGGGGGSGKTSSLETVEPGFASKYDAIYDTTLSSEKKAIQSIEDALNSGRTVRINFTVRDPLESIVGGIIPRARSKGRTVPLDVAAKAHEEAPAVLQALRERYVDDDRVSFRFVDNTRGQGQSRVISPREVPQFDYNQLVDRALSAATDAYEQGQLSEAAYRGLAGEVGRERSARLRRSAEGSQHEDSGRQPESERPAARGRGEARTAEEAVKPSPLADAPSGRVTSVVTERGAKIDVQYRLVDVGNLITSHDDALKVNPAFDPELQPRDRSRMQSEAQISAIENNLKPELLAKSPKASDGAPIVGADGMVESGNARTIALRRAYAAGKANKYRLWLIDHADRFGLTEEQARAMKQPVLVRQGLGKYDRADFARQANESAVSAMSETEMAAADAKRLPDLEGLHIDSEGLVNISKSPGFVRDFMQLAAGPNERNALMTSDGRLSQRGLTRIRNAVFAKAYGDSSIVSMLTESLDENVKNILKGLERAAPEVAKLRELMEAGARQQVNFVPDLVEAVRRFSAVRDSGMTVKQHLAQGDLMGGEASPRVAELMKELESNARAPRRVADMIQRFVDEIDMQGDPRQAGMFADNP